MVKLPPLCRSRECPGGSNCSQPWAEVFCHCFDEFYIPSFVFHILRVLTPNMELSWVIGNRTSWWTNGFGGIPRWDIVSSSNHTLAYQLSESYICIQVLHIIDIYYTYCICVYDIYIYMIHIYIYISYIYHIYIYIIFIHIYHIYIYHISSGNQTWQWKIHSHHV